MDKEREAFEVWIRNYIKANPDCWDMTDCEKESMFHAWQAKAKAVQEGFVLIKDDTKTVVAIERMVEQQVEASGMDSRRLERLDGWKIIEAAVKAQEQK